MTVRTTAVYATGSRNRSRSALTSASTATIDSPTPAGTATFAASRARAIETPAMSAVTGPTTAPQVRARVRQPNATVPAITVAVVAVTPSAVSDPTDHTIATATAMPAATLPLRNHLPANSNSRAPTLSDATAQITGRAAAATTRVLRNSQPRNCWVSRQASTATAPAANTPTCHQVSS